MTQNEQRLAAKQFAEYWKDKGDEKQETQAFWLSLLSQLFAVPEPEKLVQFELPVKLSHTSFIDAYIESTKVLIEQKGREIDLTKGYKQSDGQILTPFMQARRYAGSLPHNQNPRWIVVCNFREFEIHDMNRPNDPPERILLSELDREIHRLSFLIDTGSETIKREMELSLKAGEIVGLLYDALSAQYRDPASPRAQRSLNILCVRLVFCLYAEDAGIFGKRLLFHDYIKTVADKEGDVRRAIMDLFRVLDTPEEGRDPYEEELNRFPYVNGGLFSEEDIEIPRFTPEITALILNKASADFDWSEISPTIFGAVFESTLNPETRRAGGMHYTSLENIHKVIDPLFLEDLKAELEEIKAISVVKTRREKLRQYQDKLASLSFLDPAAGSGNFLTESFLSLRRLENEALTNLTDGQMLLGFEESNPVKVSISQFYGIEINDFAVSVARTALWIAEHQMLRETEAILHQKIDFLPLKSYAGIAEGNALRMDWETVVSKEKLNYIMGNPPFVGYSLQSRDQKEDILSIYVDEKGKPYKTAGKIDYVAGWFFKASQLMHGTHIRTALVATNSITQGEQVAAVWKPLYERFGIHIDFAHRSFIWNSESNDKAHVHCVIVGFSVSVLGKEKALYGGDRKTIVSKINAYLIDAPDVFIESKVNPICDVPSMVYGNKPTDGGFLFLTPEEHDDFVKKEPFLSQKYARQILGATEYINNKKRYCLWLVNASPKDIRDSAFIRDRVEKVRAFRASSPKEATMKSASFPYLFQEVRQPDKEYIIVPRHSSETRRYIPFGFVSPDIIVNDAVQIIPGASIYHFGIMVSNVHMAWVRAVCGRIKSDYRYSKDIVYNNFPWPSPTQAQQEEIEATAQGILDARALYPEASLADLYDELTMPPELRTAHRKNDAAVLKAYGFPLTISEPECVARLMEMYQVLTER